MIRWTKSAAGQRALMTVRLRGEIKEHDRYACVQCRVSVAAEPHLLLEIDHIMPVSQVGAGAYGRFDASGSLDQGCGIKKCATTVRNRTTGTVKTTIREMRPSQRFARGRSNSPTMTVASNAKRMPALINDARTGNNCGGHTAGRLAEQAQPGRTGCAIQSTNKPRRTTQAATTGERVAPCVWMGMSPDYRSGMPVARRPRRRGRRHEL